MRHQQVRCARPDGTNLERVRTVQQRSGGARATSGRRLRSCATPCGKTRPRPSVGASCLHTGNLPLPFPEGVTSLAGRQVSWLPVLRVCSGPSFRIGPSALDRAVSLGRPILPESGRTEPLAGYSGGNRGPTGITPCRLFPILPSSGHLSAPWIESASTDLILPRAPRRINTSRGHPPGLRKGGRPAAYQE